jgi:membrane-bound lytic murein transglycosylase B
MLKSRRSRLLAAGAAVLAAVGLVVGVVSSRASAQTPTPSPTATPRPGKQQLQQRLDEFLNRLAQNLGVTPDRLRDALRQTAVQEVDAAQAAGRLTPEQAQRLKDAINQGKVPFLGLHGPLFGPGGVPGHLGMGLSASLDQLAQFLGISPDQLRQELRNQSLAQVAQAHGKTADQLKQFILDNVRQRLNQAVQQGRITQQQADNALNKLQQRLDDLINRTPGGRGLGPRMHMGR